MHFQSMYGFGNTLICQLCRSSLHLKHFDGINKRLCATSGNFKDADMLLFFKSEVQTILRNLTGFDIYKVLKNRKLGEKLEPPEYKFMTSEEVKKETVKAEEVAKEMLQMPPVVPLNKDVEVILSKDPELIGLEESKIIFTDISSGKTDRTRVIVVRDIDGTLRKANRMERRNANQAYFPRPGRQYRIPKMFQPEFLKPVLERGDYIFILDRACVEFDADDPEYREVTHAVYNYIEEKQAYGTLRFTRHFGPMAFYLVLIKNIDNLLLENLKTDRLEDAAMLISLYHIVHPTAESAETKLKPGQEIAFIKDFINKDAKMKVALDLALLSYSKPSEDLQAIRV